MSSLLRRPTSWRHIGPPFFHEFEFDHEHDEDHPDGAWDGTISHNDFYYTDNVELTRADRKTYTGQAKAQRAKGFQRIDVTFDDRGAKERHQP